MNLQQESPISTDTHKLIFQSSIAIRTNINPCLLHHRGLNYTASPHAHARIKLNISNRQKPRRANNKEKRHRRKPQQCNQLPPLRIRGSYKLPKRTTTNLYDSPHRHPLHPHASPKEYKSSKTPPVPPYSKHKSQNYSPPNSPYTPHKAPGTYKATPVSSSVRSGRLHKADRSLPRWDCRTAHPSGMMKARVYFAWRPLSGARGGRIRGWRLLRRGWWRRRSA